jgi:hypothetical protein
MKVLSMKLKNEENDERSRGRMLGFDLPPLGLTTFWALFSCPDRGRPTLHGWWTPSHCAIYRGGGRLALGTRFILSRHSPPIFPDPDPRGAQPVTGSRHRLHCTTTSLHRLLSPPNVTAGAQMASTNETPADASTTPTAPTTTAFDGLRLHTTPIPFLPFMSFVVYILGSCKHCKSRT